MTCSSEEWNIEELGSKDDDLFDLQKPVTQWDIHSVDGQN